MKPHCVLKDWVFGLPYRQQSVLLSALRGCDTARKDDPSKFVTRALRTLLLNNADPSNTFMVGDGVPDADYVKTFLWDLDSYPMHFVAHIMHAAEIVGYKHPEERDPLKYESENVKKWWANFYLDLVKALHLNPETEAQLDIRLGFTEVDEKDFKAVLEAEQPGKKPKASVKAKTTWDAGTGTSHGGRDRDWSGGS
jgi:hypothetical protein